MNAMQAIVSLRWTRLKIVQRDSTASQFPAGTVVNQRPSAGTPTNSALAETLFVAAAPQKPTHRGTSWADFVGGVVSRLASPTTPPPDPASTDSLSSRGTPTEV